MADIKKYNGSTWEHSLRKMTTATADIEPTIYTDGTAITAYTIKGNTVQNGTPTPSNPVEVNGVGVRTANLFDKNTMTANAYLSQSDGQYLSSTGQSYSCIIKIKPNTSYRVRTASQTMRIAFFTQYPQNNDTPTAYYNHDSWGSYVPRAFIETSGNANTYMVVFCYSNALEYEDGKTVDEIMSTVMISEGAEMAFPFEPYGYKIPISSGGVTTNIYLGSTQTTRQIKKKVLTGNEDWQTQAGQYRNDTALFTLWQNLKKMQNRPSVNTHFISAASGVNPQTQNYVCSGYHPANDYSNYYYIRPSFSTIGITSETSGTAAIAAFKAWLADQYAAGTPVTLWYVLDTAETATVNEPLMKIGNYADTLSNAVQIPITEGANSITVDTTVQPSEFTATWTGWHDANVKEWDGSDWQ